MKFNLNKMIKFKFGVKNVIFYILVKNLNYHHNKMKQIKNILSGKTI